MTPQEMFSKLVYARMNAREDFNEDLEDKAILWAYETIIYLEADLEIAREKLKQIEAIVDQAPELNMSNFDMDQVTELNNSLIEIYQVLQPDEDVEII